MAPSNCPVQAWLHFRPEVLEYFGYYYKYRRCVAFEACVDTNRSPLVAAVRYQWTKLREQHGGCTHT